MAIPADAPASPSDRFDSQRVPWTGRDVGAGIAWFIGAFVGGQILVAFAAIIIGSTTSRSTYAAAFVIGAVVEVSFGVIAWQLTVGKYRGGPRLIGVGPMTGRTLAWGGFAFVAALLVSLVYGVVIQGLHIEQLQTQCAEQIPDGVRHSRWLLALASLVVIIFAPLFEEPFFRGFLFPGLARLWGVAPAIVVSGLLFAGAHLDYKSFIPIAGVGMVFAFTYWRSGAIFSAVIGHLAFNSTSIALIAAGSCESVAGRPGALLLTQLLTALPAVHAL
ncbi:MAG: CPBP family intramembrane metalloprotease [Dehalococcoidia bacterium]|nr:CPBP family intramembrane metalloprotease [Dehalococcoidia bacterium]